MAKKKTSQRSLFDLTEQKETPQHSLFDLTEQKETPKAPELSPEEILARDLLTLTPAQLEAEIAKHNALYNAGTPEISDELYDRLIQRLRALQPQSRALDELTSPDVAETSAGKVIHDRPMLSLEKAEKGKEFADIRAWLGRFEGDFLGTPKIDGLACSICYDAQGDLQIASTRGDGHIGENITPNVRFINAIPKHIEIPGLEVRGEVYMPLSAFRAFNGEKKSARNLAVGGLKQKDARETARYGLSFFAYEALGMSFDTDLQKFETLRKLGFQTVNTKHFTRTDQPLDALMADIRAWCNDMAEERPTWDFDADGLVFKVNDCQTQLSMGFTDHHPKCAIAYKFACDQAETVLRAVEWQVAKGATLTPVAVFDGISLAGALVQRATLSNAEQVRVFPLKTKDSKETAPLHIGDTILVSRRGDVIPHVECCISTPEGALPVPMPDKCPSCGSPVIEDGKFLRCSDPENCPSTGQALIENYTKIVNCMGIGEKIIESLYDAGLVKTPADLYRLDPSIIASALSQSDDSDAILPGKLYDAIQSTRKQPLAVFLEALSIPSLGHVTSREIAERVDSLGSILNANVNQIIKYLESKTYNSEQVNNYYDKIHSTPKKPRETIKEFISRCIPYDTRALLIDSFPDISQLLKANPTEICDAINKTLKIKTSYKESDLNKYFKLIHTHTPNLGETTAEYVSRCIPYKTRDILIKSFPDISILMNADINDICKAMNAVTLKTYNKDGIIKDLYEQIHASTPKPFESSEEYISRCIFTKKQRDLIKAFPNTLTLLSSTLTEICNAMNAVKEIRLYKEDGIIEKIYNNIHASEPHSGETTKDYLYRCVSNDIHQHFIMAFPDVSTLLLASPKDIKEALNGVKVKTATAIHRGLKQRRALIDDLLQFVTIEDSATAEASQNGVFAGMTFLFTGSLESMKREEAQARVEALGGKAASGVSKTLSVLVATSSTSTKWRKALELNAKGANIKLWTEADFLKALENV